MIDKIREKIEDNTGVKVKVVVNNIRNKKEEFSGVIEKSYKYIFVIKSDNDFKKTFSYSDVLVQNIEIFFE